MSVLIPHLPSPPWMQFEQIKVKHTNPLQPHFMLNIIIMSSAFAEGGELIIAILCQHYTSHIEWISTGHLLKVTNAVKCNAIKTNGWGQCWSCTVHKWRNASFMDDPSDKFCFLYHHINMMSLFSSQIVHNLGYFITDIRNPVFQKICDLYCIKR